MVAMAEYAGKGMIAEDVKKNKKREKARSNRKRRREVPDKLLDIGNVAERPKDLSIDKVDIRRKRGICAEVLKVSAAGGRLKPAGFLEKMRARLLGGQFRMLNETLYTCRGEDAYNLFKKDPPSFHLYHTGYQEQMSKWPQLPVEVVINWLCNQNSKFSVADFGCGDARLAKSVKNKVFSLDLISSDPSVIACNMAHTPLETASVDVAVFCLSLMGTDYSSFLTEAHRVLRPSGWLLIAEVKSRFDIESGCTNPQKFVTALTSLGFSLSSQDFSNKMFLMFYFRKEGVQKLVSREIKWPQLKPCVYKRR